MFDVAKKEALNLISRDHWRRYRDSIYFKSYMEEVLAEEHRFPLTTQAAILKDAAILVQKEGKHLREERRKVDEDKQLISAEFERLESMRLHILAERGKLVEEKLLKSASKLSSLSRSNGSGLRAAESAS